jgi:hypothetical protein
MLSGQAPLGHAGGSARKIAQGELRAAVRKIAAHRVRTADLENPLGRLARPQTSWSALRPGYSLAIRCRHRRLLRARNEFDCGASAETRTPDPRFPVAPRGSRAWQYKVAIRRGSKLIPEAVHPAGGSFRNANQELTLPDRKIGLRTRRSGRGRDRGCARLLASGRSVFGYPVPSGLPRNDLKRLAVI